MKDLNKAVINFYKKLFTIKECSSRKEYWLVIAYCLLVLLAISGGVLLAVIVNGWSFSVEQVALGIIGIFCLVNFMPMLSLQVRRLHDIDHSGWWILLVVIPYVNIIGFWVILIWSMLPSNPTSKYRQPSNSLNYNRVKSESLDVHSNKVQTVIDIDKVKSTLLATGSATYDSELKHPNVSTGKAQYRYCPHCGKLIEEEEANYCKYCGELLKQE